MYCFVDQMARISAEERRKRWEKLKFSSMGTNIPKIHPKGFILEGKMRLVEESTSDSPDVRAQRL